MRLAVDVAVKRALQDEAEQRADEKGEQQGRKERHAVAIDGDDRDIAARHRERAMREIDEIHQAERDGEPAGQHEQQHAVGDTVEQDRQHVRMNVPACTVRAPRHDSTGFLNAQEPGQGKRAATCIAARSRVLVIYFFAALTGSLTFSKVANSTL